MGGLSVFVLFRFLVGGGSVIKELSIHFWTKANIILSTVD